MSVQFQKWNFNVEDYYRMAEAGLFSEHDRVVLIDGEVIKKSPIGSRHAGCVDRLNSILNRKVGDFAIVSVQNPVRLNDFSEPEPDIALLKPRDDFYSQSHPTAADVLLVIEVAETSVEYDRSVKMPLYARAGIPEAWLVNLPKDIIEIYTQPKNGKYQKVQRLKRGKSLVSPTVTGLLLSVNYILG
ncbi:MAG TPA: Uma2 family endonuclease [Blastocatellia bacterium]|nr:Uma2 family endonuclease [Blastocatellia bacterium]